MNKQKELNDNINGLIAEVIKYLRHPKREDEKTLINGILFTNNELIDEIKNKTTIGLTILNDLVVLTLDRLKRGL